MQWSKHLFQRLRAIGNRDDTNVVGHQAIDPDPDLEPPTELTQPVQVDVAVGAIEKGVRSTVASLRDVVRDVRKRLSGDSRQAERIANYCRRPLYTLLLFGSACLIPAPDEADS